MASKGKGGKTAQKPTTDTQYEKMEEPLDEQELESLYAWVDSIPLSRPKRNIARDFSDGVLVAEIIRHFFPKDGLVELHSYSSANATPKKKENWYYLNRRVFSRMNFELAEDVINDLVGCKPGMIEKVLLMLQVKIKRAEYARGRQSDKPEADQHLSPGRKDGRMIKVDMDSTKGNKFVKTKQEIDRLEIQDIQSIGSVTKSKLEIRYPTSKENEIREGECKQSQKSRAAGNAGTRIDDYGTVITQRYLENRGWNSGIQEQKPQPKKPASNVIPKRRPGPMIESDMVPRYLVEEKEQEVLTRDETIQMLQAKVGRLEQLLQLKDHRISELTSSLSVQLPLPSQHASGGHHPTYPHRAVNYSRH